MQTLSDISERVRVKLSHYREDLFTLQKGGIHMPKK